MKIFDCRQIKEIDAYTISNEPILSIDLMERAANACVSWMESRIDHGTKIMIFTGPGNNGGDGWAIARLLIEKSFQAVSVYQLNISNMISTDSQINRQRLTDQGRAGIFEVHPDADLPDIDKNCIVIDALFGSGLSRPLSGFPAKLVRHINVANNRTIAIDIPSGLMGEDNAGNDENSIIRASETIAFQFPKRSFLYSENEKFVGNWQVLDIGLHSTAIRSTPSDFYFVEGGDISDKLGKRSRFSHKGIYGHALFIAGSYGMLGAAILGANACLRTGVGLLTTHVPRLGYPVIQGKVPESIFSIDKSEECFSEVVPTEGYQAIGVGPGIGRGTETKRALEKLLKECTKPMVIDADALNIMAANKELLQLLPPRCIITPHPKEFDRLFGDSVSGYQRNLLQIEMAKKHNIIILLKGAFSSTSLPDGSCFFNSTGNPGMSTAGCGDVLTGMILSLLAQGYDPADASVTGAFIHGLAGDLAAAETGYQALVASDIIDCIGKAFIKLKEYEP